jgi:predicted nuclease with TOPRIM domain
MANNELSPAEQVSQKLDRTRSQISDLTSEVRLAGIQDKLEDLTNTTSGLNQRIKELRARQYAFEAQLETQADDLHRRWKQLVPSIERQVAIETRTLRQDLEDLEEKYENANRLSRNPRAALNLLDRLEDSIDALDDKVDSIETTIKGKYDHLENEINELVSFLTRIENAIDELDEACFSLLASESLIMAVDAVWFGDNKEDKNDPEGVLYLTDQRIIFEQKEKIAKKKVLFITTESELVQRLLFDFPVALVEDAEASKQGMFKNKDQLEITLSHGGPFDNAFLHLKGQSSNDWRALIKRAKEGNFNKNRAIEVDQEEVEKVKNAPTICPNCGGALTQTVLRGMDSINCEFCGTIIRL